MKIFSGFKNQKEYELIDFKDKQIFKNLNTYTSICILRKSNNASYTYKEPDCNFEVTKLQNFKY